MRKISYIFLMLVLSCSLFSCRQEGNGDNLILSVSSYTFSYDGSDSLVVEVAGAENGFKASTESDFISLSEPEGNKITIRVSENGEAVYRYGQVFFTSGNASAELSLEQEPLRFVGPFFEIPPQSLGTISPNGRYMAYVYNRWEGTVMDRVWASTAYLVNTETGEVSDLDMPDYPNPVSGGPQAFNNVKTLSDDARVIVYEHNMSTAQAVVVDGEVVVPSLPEGYNTPSVSSVSSDGSVWVGFCSKKSYSYNTYYPVKWINGEPQILDFPENDIFGERNINGAMARGCACDGSVVYGSEWRYFGLMYWKDGVTYPIGQDNAVVDGNQFDLIKTESQNMCMSPNGRYIACKTKNYYPVLVDTETGMFKIMESAEGFLGTAVTDEGIVFGCTYGLQNSSVLDFDNARVIPIQEWFNDKYGIILSDYNVVKWVSTDGKVYFGDHKYPGEAPICTQWFVRVEK